MVQLFETHKSGLFNISEGLLKHGLGLNYKPKYKKGFITKTGDKTFAMYDLMGKLLLNFTSSPTAAGTPWGYAVCPGRGLIALATRRYVGNNTVAVIDIINGTTGDILATIFETVTLRDVSITFLESGELVVLNSYDAKVKIYSENGVLLRQSQSPINTVDRAGANLAYFKKRNVLFAYSGSVAEIKIIDIETLQVVGSIDKTLGEKLLAVTADGDIILESGYQIAKKKINYSNFNLSETIYSSVIGTGSKIFAGLYKNEIYITHLSSSTANTSTFTILRTSDLSLISSTSLNYRVLSVDDKYLYAKSYPRPFNIKILNKSNFHELITVTSELSLFNEELNHNKGDYANFNKYW